MISDNQKKFTWSTKLLVVFLALMICSLINLTFGQTASVDIDLKPKISQLLNVETIGYVQSVETRVIGPFTAINLKFFKVNEQLVSAKARQFFWFSPQITCVSSNPEHIC